MPASQNSSSLTSRRHWLQQSAAGLTGMLAAGHLAAQPNQAQAKEVAGSQKIHQSVVNWCYRSKFESFDAFCKFVAELGYESVELCDPSDWPTLKKYGLTCAIAGSHGFREGLNNPANWEQCFSKIRERIQAAAEFGCKRVITFTGMSGDLSLEQGAKNCVDALQQILPDAEKAGVDLCLEHLNSRDDSHPMKGHPGYQGDDVDYCFDILNKAGSPNAKLLFDIYHVQIMNGDVIRRIDQNIDRIGHVHTAGNPGRCELDADQEINFPAIMKALLRNGYTGFVGQEYIPTREVKAGLKQAYEVCNVQL